MTHLGIIPTWQFSPDPGVNIKLNPHVVFPPGMNQRTIQGAMGPIEPQPSSARTWPNCQSCPGSLQGPLDFANSWAWQNRKWFLFGGLVLAGAGLFSLLK